MAKESVKVPEDQFKAVLKALLNAPPMPASDITPKREPTTKKRAAKRR
jgi:hypothetical protein